MDPQQPATQPADVPAAPADVPPPPAPEPAAPPPVSTAPAVPPPSQVTPPYWQGGAQPAGPAPGVEFAGLGARFIAYVIDAFIASIIVFALSLVLVPVLVGTTNGDGEISSLGAATITVWVGIVILVSVLYFPFFWQRSGQTPAMKMLGIRVVRNTDGGPIGWGSAILRYIGYAINSIVFGLPIGWLWAAIDSRRRGWHDLIGGTVVIKA